MNAFPRPTASSSTSRSTSSPYSLFPVMAPSAMAIGSPTIPVPGMPTPMAFFSMLALSMTLMLSGRVPRVSVAFATQRATAIGSVHPMAGTTSRLTRFIILSRNVFSIMVFCCCFSCHGIPPSCPDALPALPSRVAVIWHGRDGVRPSGLYHDMSPSGLCCLGAGASPMSLPAVSGVLSHVLCRAVRERWQRPAGVISSCSCPGLSAGTQCISLCPRHKSMTS